MAAASRVSGNHLCQSGWCWVSGSQPEHRQPQSTSWVPVFWPMQQLEGGENGQSTGQQQGPFITLKAASPAVFLPLSLLTSAWAPPHTSSASCSRAVLNGPPPNMFGIGVCSSLEEKGSSRLTQCSPRAAVQGDDGRQDISTGLARRSPAHLPITSTVPDLQARVGLLLLHSQELSLNTKSEIGHPSLTAPITL